MKKHFFSTFLAFAFLFPMVVHSQPMGKKIRKVIYEDPLYIELRDIKLNMQANGELQDWAEATADPQKSKVDGVLVSFFRIILKDPQVNGFSLMVLEEVHGEYVRLTARYNNLITRIQSDIQTKVVLFKDFEKLDYEGYGKEIKGVIADFKAFCERLRAISGGQFISPEMVVAVLKIVVKGIEILAVRTVKRVLIEELDHLRVPPIDWSPLYAVVQAGKATMDPIKQLDVVKEVSKDAAFAAALKLPNLEAINAAQITEAFIREKARLEGVLSEPGIDADEKAYFQDKLSKVEEAKVWFDQHPPVAVPSVVPNKGSSEKCLLDEFRNKLEGMMSAFDGDSIPKAKLEKQIKDYR